MSGLILTTTAAPRRSRITLEEFYKIPMRRSSATSSRASTAPTLLNPNPSAPE